MNKQPEGIEETATSSDNSGNNNSSNASEGDKTQKNGPPKYVPYERFKDVIDENNRLKGTGSAPETSSSSSGQQEDRLLEVISKVPDRLKSDTAAIAKYAKEHSMSIEDTIVFWDAKNRVAPEDVAKANEADAAARDSRLGGTANPAARQENKPLSEMKTEDLKSQLEQRIAAGEKI